MDRRLPKASEPLMPGGKPPTISWRLFFENLASQTDNAALQAKYLALAARLSALEDRGGSLATVVGQNGISVSGSLTGDVLRIILAGGLDNLSDVDLTTTPPVPGDALVYDGAAWVPGAGGGSGVLPLVTGEVPPVLVYADDGSLIYAPASY